MRSEDTAVRPCRRQWRQAANHLAEASGAKISAKDFHTFRASATALAVLAEHNGHDSETLRKKAIVEAADEHAERGPLELYPSERDRSLRGRQA
jgi:hypothetical protein